MFQNTLYHTGRLATALYVKARLNADVVWQAPLPKGPKIIAPNHPTSSDPIWLTGLIPERMHYIFTHSLGQVPLVRWYLNQTGHLVLNPAEGRSTFDRAVEVLRKGKTMAVFPEGCLSPLDKGLARARTGVVRMALTTGAPIIPVGISIRDECIRYQSHDLGDHVKTGRWYMNGPYAVTIGEPVYLEGDANDRERVVALSAVLMNRILDLRQDGNHRLRNLPSGRYVTVPSRDWATQTGSFQAHV